jgi:hypothetical protein
MGKVSIAAAGAALLCVSPVRAQDAPPGSAVDQYVEQVPTASGPAAPGVTKATRDVLPRAGAKALKKAPPKTAKALEEIATSSNYGAPKVGSKPKPKPKPTPTKAASDRKSDEVTTTTVRATLRSSVGALGTASDTRLIVLLAVLLVSSLAAVALSVRRTA